MALGVMRVLQVLAHEQGMMVIATIHQVGARGVCVGCGGADVAFGL